MITGKWWAGGQYLPAGHNDDATSDAGIALLYYRMFQRLGPAAVQTEPVCEASTSISRITPDQDNPESLKCCRLNG